MCGTANKTLRSVHPKSTKPKTSPGWTPPSESNLTASPSRKCGSLQKAPERVNRSDLLDRGCVSRKRNLTRRCGAAEDVRGANLKRKAGTFIASRMDAISITVDFSLRAAKPTPSP